MKQEGRIENGTQQMVHQMKTIKDKIIYTWDDGKKDGKYKEE